MNSSSVELRGIDGANPLGFLAALGTTVVLHLTGVGRPRLAWTRSTTWRPVLSGISMADRDICDRLAEVLRGRLVSADSERLRMARQVEYDAAKKALKDKRDDIRKRGLRGADRQATVQNELAALEHSFNAARQNWLANLRDAVASPELAIGKHIDCGPDEFRDHAIGFLAEAGRTNRGPLDLLAAFGTDAHVERSERITATPFCFITGSGHQYFLDTVRQLMDTVTAERVYEALFRPWVYGDEKLSMRWDPIEDRRYALMDRNPTASDNKTRTVWMANLLAYRALVLFPSAPGAYGPAVTGWRLRDAKEFTWPIWENPLDVETIRSVLQLRELVDDEPSRVALRQRGILAVFRARRIEVGNRPLHKINFSPARPV